MRKAIREAPEKLFGSNVYQLDNGSYALSSRGAARALIGEEKRETKGASFKRYLSVIAGEKREIKLEFFEFLTPNNSKADGVSLDDFVVVVQAYADAYLAGTLRENQQHIGLNCARMQAAAARLGWEAMVRALFGEALPPAQVPVLFQQYLRDHATAWEPFYDWELPELLKHLIRFPRGQSRKLGPAYPVWMKGIHQYIYDCALGGLADAARSRRDELQATTIPQVLTDEVKRSMKSHWQAIKGAARESSDLAQFKRLVAALFGTTVKAVDSAQARARERARQSDEQIDLFGV